MTIKLPKNINELEKILVFIESNPKFIEEVNYNDLFAYFIMKNKIDMIAKLNNFIREFDLTLSPKTIYRTMAGMDARQEMAELEKNFGSDICVNYDFEKYTLIMMDRYSDLFNKKY